MSTTSASGNGSADPPDGAEHEPRSRASSGRGVAIVIVAVVIGVLLLPSATRAPLAASAKTTAPTTTVASVGRAATRGHGHGHHAGTSTSTSTSTTVPPASIHVLVANATTTNGVAGGGHPFPRLQGIRHPDGDERTPQGHGLADLHGRRRERRRRHRGRRPQPALDQHRAGGGDRPGVERGRCQRRRDRRSRPRHALRPRYRGDDRSGLTGTPLLPAGPVMDDPAHDESVSLGPLAALLMAPASTAVLTDFDGTLSPIVPDPADARPLPEAPGVLAAPGPSASPPWPWSRAGRWRSWPSTWRGRARRCVCSAPTGSSGWKDGVVHVLPRPSRGWRRRPRWWRRPGREFAVPGWGSRTRGGSVTVHWRQAPEAGGWAEEFARQWAGRTGLVLQTGRMAVELRPPVRHRQGAGGRAPGRGVLGGVLRRRRRR